MLRSEGTIVEKLDALMWININAVDRFSDEYNIQLAWIRESPPSTANLGLVVRGPAVATSSRCWRRASGPGELHVEGPSADIRAWALFELLWMPENIVQTLGPAGRSAARPRDDAAGRRRVPALIGRVSRAASLVLGSGRRWLAGRDRPEGARAWDADRSGR